MNEGAVSLSQLTGILTTSYFSGANHSISAETEDRTTEMIRRLNAKRVVIVGRRTLTRCCIHLNSSTYHHAHRSGLLPCRLLKEPMLCV